MLKIAEINKMDINGIQAKITEVRKEIFELNLQKNTSSLEKSHLLKNLKKDVARLLTVANQKKRNS